MIGIPRRTYHRWQANARRTGRAKGPWPAPVVDAVEPLVAQYADDWPGWGHRKVYGLMRADGHTASASSVLRAMRRRGLLQPIDYQGQRRERPGRRPLLRLAAAPRSRLTSRQELLDEQADEFGPLADEAVRRPRDDAQLRAGNGRGDEQAVVGADRVAVA